ncbi:LLM class flavin-dependent oxidoreductase [Nonomuraea sp. KC401]|uniref:LLM class flavin-dependent oxidoreductase n=1 Tax=unclassified Nonomuraea TaxID=2593643 RepID=UPI0010FE946B|nr:MULTISPECIES: LLM class flavin-dependent oxidoreductase [unclassified Nonomuraea]NBE97497.1 LLM class flavin-dependent oxidoreductase [Nonomuraea sp. K271]TLF62619.1 LLM class flavin-dependent oxidoreductase [Nonomuraea sp. KC401]
MVKFGVGLPTMQEIETLGPGGVARAARLAETVGADAVSAPDVLVGDGTTALESVVALATAAAVTERVSLDFGVLSVPTRPVAMMAAQVQTLQHLSRGRVRLGVGIGGFPGSPFWAALGAPRTGRGRMTDEALRALPGLIAGRDTTVANGVSLTLAPAAPVPPLFVGSGTSGTALRRVARLADGWLASALTPAGIRTALARLRELAEEYGRPMPRVLLGVHTVLGADREARQAMEAQLAEFFQLSADEARQAGISGSPAEAAERVSAFAEAGVDEIGFALDGRDFLGQIELVGEIRTHLPQ